MPYTQVIFELILISWISVLESLVKWNIGTERLIFVVTEKWFYTSEVHRLCDVGLFQCESGNEMQILKGWR